MTLNKNMLIDKACEITKAYARGGGNVSVEIMLRRIYKELEKINAERQEELR